MTIKSKRNKALDELRIMHLALAQERDYLRSIVQSLAESRIARLVTPSLHSKAKIAIDYISK
jgi:hypothetical protein